MPVKAVAQEFQELQRYSQRSKSCIACIKQDRNCTHPLPTLCEKFAELKRKKNLKAFSIVISLFILAEFTGITGMQPYMVQVLAAYESPIAPDQAAAIVTAANNLGTITFLCLIRFTGKRPLYLTMLFLTFFSAAVIFSYGFAVLPLGHNSFKEYSTFALENRRLAFIPFVFIVLWSFSSHCGVDSLPWQFLTEIFSFQ